MRWLTDAISARLDLEEPLSVVRVEVEVTLNLGEEALRSNATCTFLEYFQAQSGSVHLAAELRAREVKATSVERALSGTRLRVL